MHPILNDMNRRGRERYMKKTTLMAAILVLLLTPYAAVAAEGGSIECSANTTILLNGKEVKYYDSIFINGRFLVPLRPIAEALDATVEWQPPDTVYIHKGETRIVLKIDSTTVLKNQETVFLEQPPIIVRGRTVVSLRFLEDALGAHADWDADLGLITIESDGVFTSPRQPIGDYLLAGVSLKKQYPNPGPTSGPVLNEAGKYVLEQGFLNKVEEIQYTPSYLYEHKNYDTLVIGSDGAGGPKRAVWLTKDEDTSRISVLATVFLDEGISRDTLFSILKDKAIENPIKKVYLTPVKDRVCWLAIAENRYYYVDFHTGEILIENTYCPVGK